MESVDLLKELHRLEGTGSPGAFGLLADTVESDLRSRGVDVSNLDQNLDAMSSAGVIAQTFQMGPSFSNERRYIRLSDVGRTFAEAKRSPGRGALFDDPYSSALLVMGLREGLIKLSGSREQFRRELRKGQREKIQLEMLRALVLFEDVVVPGDKAATDYFDWGGLRDTVGLRITPHLPGRQGMRSQALTGPATFLPTGDDRLSAWDNIVRGYLGRRRLPTAPLPDDFATSTDIGYALNTYATAEDLELFIPDFIELRVNNFIRDRFGPEAQDNPRLVAAVRGAFWRVETFFHLRYLASLAENEWLPGVIRTRLGSVRTLTDVDAALRLRKNYGSGVGTAFVYSLFLKEILTLPRPETLSEAIEWRSKPHIAEFREVFFGWHDKISEGSADEVSLRHELQKISRSARRLKGWGRAAGIQTYLCVPETVALGLVAGPVGFATGIGIAVIGAVTQKWIGRGSRKQRWMLVGEL